MTCPVVVFILCLVVGCQLKEENGNLINYDQLQKLEVSLISELKESEDFIAGKLLDLVLTSDGTILVSDIGNKTIVQINKHGEHVKTIAEKGNGPGELPSLFFLHNGRKDTLIVRHGDMSYRTDYFSKQSGNIYGFVKSPVREKFDERSVTILGVSTDAEYYAKTPWNSKVIRQQLVNYPEFYWLPIVTVDKFDNILQDSLHFLKTPTPIIDWPSGSGMIYYGVPPYQYQDFFKPMKNGKYLIARSDSSAMYIYDRDHRLTQKLSLKVKKRRVESADIDYFFNTTIADREVRRKKLARVPVIKPPFLNVWVSKNNIWLLTDIGEKGKQIVALSMKGEPTGTFYLSVYDDIRYFRDGRIYALHKNPETGHSIRVYELL